MAHDWRSAFAAQARSDYKLFRRLCQLEGVENCHRIHYLCMVTEKVAKAFLTNGRTQPQTSHYVFTKFLKAANQNRTLRNVCGYKNRLSAFRGYLEGIKKTAQEVENLVPKSDCQAPNPEYPWLLRTSKLGHKTIVEVPAEYNFKTIDLKSPKVLKMLRFIEICLETL